MSVEGKRFERNFEGSVKAYNEECAKKGTTETEGVSLLRLYDPGHGFGGVSNICDYVVYSHPNVMYLELKSRKGNRVNFSEALTETQFEGLKEQAKVKGTIPGLLIKFDDFDEAYFIHIDLIEKHKEKVIRGKNKGKDRWSYQLNGEKSITPEMAEEVGILLMGNKKQVNWDYDIECLLRALKYRYGDS